MSPPVPGLEPLTDAQRDWMEANDQLTRWGAARLMRRRPGIERDDAISLAAMAMIRAIHKHDPARGKLATCFFQQLRYIAGRNDYYAKPLGCRHDDRRPATIPLDEARHAERDGRQAVMDPSAAAEARSILAGLPDADAGLLRLRYLDGLKLHEIGAIAGVTKECARQRINAALRRARDVAEERGYGT